MADSGPRGESANTGTQSQASDSTHESGPKEKTPEDDDSDFEVEEIINARVWRGRLEFLTRWQSDLSTTWEPLGNFPNKLEHREIVSFKEKMPKEYSVVDKFFQEKQAKKLKSHKNWVYEELAEEAEAELYEKPVEGARELKGLYDPNRLKDKEEEYLKGFQGVRISRTAVRQIKEGRAGGGSGESSRSTTVVTPDPPKEKKKRTPGGGRKKKTEAAPSSSKQTAVKVPRQRASSSRKNTDKSPSPIPDTKGSEDSEDDIKDVAPMTGGTDGDFDIEKWSRKKRAVKLNSSDSDSDFEEDIAPPKRKSVDRTVYKSRSPESQQTPAVSHEKSKPALAMDQPQSSKISVEERTPSQPPNLKRPRDTPSKSVSQANLPSASAGRLPRNPDVYYSDEEDDYLNDPDVRRLGLQVHDINLEQHFQKEDREFMKRQRYHNLTDAIRAFDLHSIECILENLKRGEIMNIITQPPYPLHEAIDNCRLGHKKGGVERLHLRVLEQMVRLVMHYLPIEVLRAQCDEKNTLLHCAANLNHVSLSKFLVDIGSPLDIRNVHELTPLECANIVKNPDLVKMFSLSGATFHYMVRNYQMEPYYAADRRWLADKTNLMDSANEVYDLLQGAFSKYLSATFPKNVFLEQFGPIVCCPRGKLIRYGFRHSIQFRYTALDQQYNPNYQYMLAVFPMKFSHIEKKFMVRTNAARMQTQPQLNKLVCLPLSEPRDWTCYFECTQSVHAQFNQPTMWLNKHNATDPKEDYKTVFCLDLLLDPTDQLDFLACQVMRYERNADSGSPDPPHSHSPPPMFTPYSSGPPPNMQRGGFRRGPSNGPHPRYNQQNNQQHRHPQGSSYRPPRHNYPYNGPNSQSQNASRPPYNRPGPSFTGSSSRPDSTSPRF